MREILFRGKQTIDGDWIYGSLVKDYNGNYNINTQLGIYVINADTIGQYTGLTDENGTKVFEGDVCRDSIGWIFKVIWDNENARFIGCHIKPRGDTYICYVGREPKVEILGNIHDNPELIKECEQE